MAKSILPKGIAAAKFKGIDINVRLLEWNDSRKPRLAIHEFLKRDGALVETMGRAPFRCKMEIVFVGEKIADEIRQFAASLDENPKGTLSHPLFGDIQVACEGFDGTLNIENGKNLYGVPVSFVEDNVDQKLSSQTTGVASQKQQVENTTDSLTTKITQYAAAATAITNLCNAALSFSVSAFDNQISFVSGAGLDNQLAELQKLTTEAVEEIRGANELDDLPEAACFDAVMLCEVLYDACSQMLAAISASKPPLTTFIVPIQMPVVNIATFLYGPDGRSRADEIKALNPNKIPNPAAVAAGTELLVSQPTAF